MAVSADTTAPSFSICALCSWCSYVSYNII